MAVAIAKCVVCGSDKPHAPKSDVCGVYRWFRHQSVQPVDLAINLGLVIDLLRVGSCVVSNGIIRRCDEYEDQKEYREERQEMMRALREAELRCFDAAATEIMDRVGVVPAANTLDYRTLAPANTAIYRRPIFQETFVESINWNGGIGNMLSALTLLQHHVASRLADTASLSDAMVREINSRSQRQRQAAVESAQKMVDQVATAVWRCQYDQIQDIVDRMYERFADDIGAIIGVDRAL